MKNKCKIAIYLKYKINLIYLEILMQNSLVDEVLNRVDIVDVISKYVPLKRAWSNFSACCPFHWEKTPSFIVSPTKQIFKCFGCGKWWNVFSFVQEIERIDFRDAVKLLAEQEHIDVSQYQTVSTYSQKFQDDKEKLKRMHKIAEEFFVTSLHNSQMAMDYLHNKRHLDDKLIEDFGIWYANDKHYELLNMLRSKWFSDSDLLEASLAKRNANWEVYAFFRNRITFPIYDLMKNVVWFSARVINPEDTPKYINSAENKAFEKSKILYGLSYAKQYINTQQKLIVVEGQMDVIWLARLWFPVWVATSWTALTEQHIKLLKRHTENLYLLFDNDQAWRQATFRALKLCYAQDMFPKIISLPDWFKDADELANNENWTQFFQQCIDNASDWFLEIFDRLRNSFDMNSPVDKTKLINTMFELILAVNNVLIQESYKRSFAEKLGFPLESVDLQFKKYVQWAWRIYLQQQRKREEWTKTQQYQPDREDLFSSLFYNWFINVQLWKGSEFIDDLYKFVEVIAKVDSDGLLAHILNNVCWEEERQKLDELQLWWENEISEKADINVKRQIIVTTITPVIQELFKLAAKSKFLTDEEKKELILLKWKLWRR